MKKLSDYRIREENGKFYIEKLSTFKSWFFLNKKQTEWWAVNIFGTTDFGDVKDYKQIMQQPFDTIEAAKAQIIKWCEEPKYHYVREFEGYSYSPNFSKGCPWDFADFYKEQLSRVGIEYFAKCNVEKELLKINPPFCKLIEKYEEKVRTGWNPKMIEKSYADLVLENFELTIKNKELEIQLHELKRKQTKNDQR